MRHTHTSAKSMTQGPIGKHILTFAFPLFLGNLFQQMYNTADSLIVGNFIDSNALAAVSSSGSLIFLLVGFFNGISIGAGVVIARYFGAKDPQNMERAIHTTIAMGLVSGVLLTIIGISATPFLLRLMGTPPEVLPSSILYFRVYFCGSIAFVMYNIFMGILQSVGDSKHPLYYLILSSITNVALDLLFVGAFRLGVGSAALATALSQFISAFLCLIRLTHTKEEYRIDLRKIHFDLTLLRQVISNGLPTGLQNSVISIANVVVQANINAFGQMAMAGCGSYSKIEGFGFLPITCFSMALTTFISQNLGAKEYDRAKKGARFGLLCSLGIAEAIGILIFSFSPVLISAFNSEPEVVAFGVAQARTVTLFYFLLASSHCLAAIFRGAGKATVPMLIMFTCWCLIRVSYITIAVRVLPDIRVVFWAYPLTWALSTLVFLVVYFRSDWVHAYEK